MHVTRGEERGALKISGTLDLSATEALQDALMECFSGNYHVQLDLSAIAACDTAALQLLQAARTTAQRSGKGFRIAAFSAAVAETGQRLGFAVENLTFEPGA